MDHTHDYIEINLWIIRIHLGIEGIITISILTALLGVIGIVAFCGSYNHIFQPFNYVAPTPTPIIVVPQ